MKKTKQRILTWLIPPLGFLILNILFLLCKKRYIISDKIPQDSPMIVAFWHGELLLQPFLYRRIRAKARIKTIISDHFDGEIIARLIRYFGFGSIRGSSSKGGKRALLRAIKELEMGGDVAITPDGPRGPYHSIADGVILIAQKANAPIVVFEASFENAWRLKSWDRFAIPKPFSQVTLIAHEPFYLTGLTFEESRAYVGEQMKQSAKIP